MKIEIKNVKHYPSMSQETNCFQCDLFINGVKVAYVRNDGGGGNTDIDPYEPHNKNASLLKEAEDFCKTLPDNVTEFGNGQTYTTKVDLESFVDDLFISFIEEKEKKKFEKQLQKDFQKGICYGSSHAYRIRSWKNNTIESLLKTTQGVESIRTQINKLKSEGKTILNTNLPKELL